MRPYGGTNPQSINDPVTRSAVMALHDFALQMNHAVGTQPQQYPTGTVIVSGGGGGLTDGTYADIEVSGGGTSWQLTLGSVDLVNMSVTGTPAPTNFADTTYLRGDWTWNTIRGIPTSPTDLQAAVDATPEGETLWLAPGTYTAPSGGLLLSRAIELRGSGQRLTKIQSYSLAADQPVIRLLSSAGSTAVNNIHIHDLEIYGRAATNNGSNDQQYANSYGIDIQPHPSGQIMRDIFLERLNVNHMGSDGLHVTGNRGTYCVINLRLSANQFNQNWRNGMYIQGATMAFSSGSLCTDNFWQGAFFETVDINSVNDYFENNCHKDSTATGYAGGAYSGQATFQYGNVLVTGAVCEAYTKNTNGNRLDNYARCGLSFLYCTGYVGENRFTNSSETTGTDQWGIFVDNTSGNQVLHIGPNYFDNVYNAIQSGNGDVQSLTVEPQNLHTGTCKMVGGALGLSLLNRPTADLSASPHAGDTGKMIYDSTSNQVKVWDGTGWQTYSETGHTHTLADITDDGTMAAVNDAPTDGTIYGRKNNSWIAAAGSSNSLLDGVFHSDTSSTGGAVSQGSLIVGVDVGGSTFRWQELSIGAATTVLTSDGTDVGWAAAATGFDTTASYAVTGGWSFERVGGTQIEIWGDDSVAQTAPNILFTKGNSQTGNFITFRGDLAASFAERANIAVDGAISTTKLKLYEGTAITGDAVTITADATTTAYSLVLPAAQGASNSYLKNNGSGTLSWATIAGGGDVVADDTTTTAQNIVAYNTTGGKNITELTGTQGDVLYHNGTNWAKLGYGTSGHFLKTQGVGANPTWAAAGGGSTPTGTGFRRVASGTEDAAAFGGTQGDVIYHNGTNWTALGAGTAGYLLKTGGAGANPSWQANDNTALANRTRNLWIPAALFETTSKTLTGSAPYAMPRINCTGAGDMRVYYAFRVPDNYVSGAQWRVHWACSSAHATNVWRARIITLDVTSGIATSSGTGSDTSISVSVNGITTDYNYSTTGFTNPDGMTYTPGNLIRVSFCRDASSDATDNHTGNVYFHGLTFAYTADM